MFCHVCNLHTKFKKHASFWTLCETLPYRAYKCHLCKKNLFTKRSKNMPLFEVCLKLAFHNAWCCHFFAILCQKCTCIHYCILYTVHKGIPSPFTHGGVVAQPHLILTRGPSASSPPHPVPPHHLTTLPPACFHCARRLYHGAVIECVKWPLGEV